jgi:hypothetical protein
MPTTSKLNFIAKKQISINYNLIIMKHLFIKILLITSLLVTGLKPSCQTPTDIELDFSKKEFVKQKALDALKRGDWYRLVVKHVNLNLYKITFDKTDSFVTSNVKTPDFTSFSLDNIAKLVGGLSPLVSQAEFFSPSVSLDSKMLSQAEKNKIRKTREEDEKKNQAIRERKKLVSEIIQQRDFLTTKAGGISTIKTEIDDMMLSIYQYQLTSKTETNTSPDYKYLLPIPFNFKANFTKIVGSRDKLKEIQKALTGGSSKYNQFSADNSKDIEKYKLSDKDEEIKDLYSASVEGANKLMDNISPDKISQLFSTIILQDNNRDYIYMSVPQQFTGDVGILHYSIEPRDANSLLQTYNGEIRFPKPGIEYVGVGVSFYYSGMYDAAYSISTTNSTTTIGNTTRIDTSYSLVGENQTKKEFGMAVLLRYGWKFSADCAFGVHFTFGPAISIADKIKPRVILGGGLSIGRKDLLVIDGGIIGGYSDRMSNLYSEGNAITVKPTQPVVSSLNAKWFLSLGYLYKF